MKTSTRHIEAEGEVERKSDVGDEDIAQPAEETPVVDVQPDHEPGGDSAEDSGDGGARQSGESQTTADEQPESPKGAGSKKPDAEPEPPSAEQPEEGVERRVSARNVAELVIDWREEYEDKKTPSDRKSELAYRITELLLGCSAGGFNPHEVNIVETDDSGVLGLYFPDTRKPAITTEGLELPAGHYKDVFVHEGAHAGKITGHRILDEGAATVVTEHRVPGALKAYGHEKHQTERAFDDVGVMQAMKLYDFDRPEELVREYLKIAWRDRWQEKFLKKMLERRLATTPAARHKLFRQAFGDDVKAMEKKFEKAVPNLHDRLTHGRGFKFKDAQMAIFDELYDEDVADRREAA